MTTMTLTSPARRIGPTRAIRHGLTLAGRAILKIRKNPAILADVIIQPILFMVMFLFLFGGAVSGNWHTYLETLTPGLMAQNIMFASVGTGIGLAMDISKGVFDRFRSLPIARSAPLVGAVLADTVRYVVALVVLVGFGMILGFRIHTNPFALLVAMLIMVAAGLALCWIGVFVAMSVRNAATAQGLMMAITMPISFGSNVYVPTSTMPGWLRAWSDVSPVTQLVNVARGLTLGGPVAGPMLGALAWLVGLVVVFMPLALRAYRRRVS